MGVRSDSKSTVEQMLELSQIIDALMCKIFFAISKLVARLRCTIVFDYLNRANNTAGILLEEWKAREGILKRRSDIIAVPMVVPSSP
ncbi:MAG: hypothetical protein M3247_06230 [Thermoproteota archaeon]|nr:hypothetical protein [Thermoproteota archaeon]